MPPSLQSSTGTTTRPSILLIEEYDALAAAIGSALRKFAPDHPTHVAHSLKEAERLVKESPPDLIVVDFDPAFAGLTEFLYKLRASHPHTRVLIIASGISHDIAVECRTLGALQFIKKPFDVADLGATVQALLGPWQNFEAHSRGTLSSLGLADIVVLQSVGGRSLSVEVKGTNGKTGEIHLADGQIIHAKAGKRADFDALEEMLRWPEARIREGDKRTRVKRTLLEPWITLFFAAWRDAVIHSPAKVAPPQLAEPAPPKPSPKIGKKIVVVDDTEMLLIFVEDTLITAQPDLQITTAVNGTAGIKEIEHVLPDLVLLDYSLPDLNGDDVCRELLANPVTANIPVLMMSGHVAEMTRAAATLDNIVAMIAKPFVSEALVALVKQTLQEGRRPTPKVREPDKLPSQQAPAIAPVPVPVEVPPPPPVEQVMAEPSRQTNGEFVDAQPAVVVVAPPLPPLPHPDTTISAPVVSKGPNDVTLGLPLEVVSMQLTPELRMGAIRAKPSSLTVSLQVASPSLRAALPTAGFQLGRVALDEKGRIATVRLIPTQQPFQAAEPRPALHLGDVALVPINSHEIVQLTPAPNAPMTMQLLAPLEIAGVELSPNFEVSQLVLRNRGSSTFRVTFGSKSPGSDDSGTTCDTLAVRLDNSARIAELLLNPIK